MKPFAQVVINLPNVSGFFDYHIPPELIGRILPGSLVTVPFGKQKVQAIVLKLVDSPQVADTKAIINLLDPLPVLTENQIELAKILAHKSLSSLSAALTLMLPPGLSQQADTLYKIATAITKIPSDFSQIQKAILEKILEKEEMRGRQLSAAFPRKNWKSAVQTLVKKGLLTSQPILSPPMVRPKTTRLIKLIATSEKANVFLSAPTSSKAQQRRQSIVAYLLNNKNPCEISELYAISKGNLQDLRKLASEEIISITETEIWRDPLGNYSFPQSQAPTLTLEQQTVWQQVKNTIAICNQRQQEKPIILYGVTGSGKTEIYLHAVKEILQAGRQAIILAPEISLTPQTAQRFAARFPNQVGLIHSRLSPGERYDTWRRARAGLLSIIIGPRSALFTPLPDPGLIIIDEFEDESYFQSEGQPRYHTTQAALTYAKQLSATLILGSATPDISTMYTAHKKNWSILQLPTRVLAHRETVSKQLAHFNIAAHIPGTDNTASLPLPPILTVDMRQELKAGNRSIFSRALKKSIQEVLQAQQQAILFINRRGSATYVFCRSCGYSLKCPNCDIPLTYHKNTATLQCHLCNYQRKMPNKCPQCHSPHIKHYGSGTEKVEEEMLTLFPQARTMRWDAETTRKKDSHHNLLSQFAQHKADILIGTQMLAKGLDLPLVTLVGVILADVGLHFPDYRANERVFRLLMQVAGRAGRSPLGGKAILQTFEPDNYVIQTAAKHDYDHFYKTEIQYRQKLGYPPFYHLARLEYRHLQPAKAEKEAILMSRQLKDWILEGQHQQSEIIGPVPCFFKRISGYYRWHIILRSPDPLSILQYRDLKDWRIEIDPPNLL